MNLRLPNSLKRSRSVLGTKLARGMVVTNSGNWSDSLTKQWSDDFERNIKREMEHFRRLLPDLLRSEKGNFVAISNGQIVDKDSSELLLAERVTKQSHKDFVLIQEVKEIEPENLKTTGLVR